MINTACCSVTQNADEQHLEEQRISGGRNDVANINVEGIRMAVRNLHAAATVNFECAHVLTVRVPE